MDRRELLKLGAIGVSTALVGGCATNSSHAQAPIKEVSRSSKKRVIIIGGGYAGLSVAKSIRLSSSECEVLVFEPKNIFASCPYSNLWFGGVSGVTFESLLFSPLEPASRYGYELVHEKVVAIDRADKTVTTLEGLYEYDILVIATGIEYDYSQYGLNQQESRVCAKLYPASYKGGEEQLSLKKKIDAFNGSVFVVTVPKGTYRCPPAPYERACMIANSFKARGLKAKVVLIDPRDKPTTKAKGFLSAFNELYKDYVEYLPSSNITGIELENKNITYEQFEQETKKYVKRSLRFDDANIIPTNRASKILKESGIELTKDGWARARAPGFVSLNDESIYIVGDALGEYPYPKSAQMANSCGIIAGGQIAAVLKGKDPNMGSILPQNVCYSMVSANEAVAVHHFVSYDPKEGIKVKAELQEERSKDLAEATKSWFAGITGNIFL